MGARQNRHKCKAANISAATQPNSQGHPEGTLYAICILNPDGNSNVKGVAKLVQEPGKKVHITAEMTGLAEGLHGFHVH